MYDVNVMFCNVGQSIDCTCNQVLAEVVRATAERIRIFNQVLPTVNFGAGEDCTFLMKRVQEHGGQANYITIGTKLAAGHHDDHFDFDETALIQAVILLSSVVEDLLKADT